MAKADDTQTQVHSRQFDRVLPLIIALERLERPTMASLAKDAGLSASELEGRVKSLQRDYRVIIERSLLDGCLVVKNWGIIERAKSSSKGV